MPAARRADGHAAARSCGNISSNDILSQALTPSALNTWLWEEVHLVGLEGEWWQTTSAGLRFGVLAGAGFGPDQMARLLSPRGWVLSDYQSGINSDLPHAHRGNADPVSVFDERDYRPAIYTRLSISDTHNRGELSLGYFDNLGDQETKDFLLRLDRRADTIPSASEILAQ